MALANRERQALQAMHGTPCSLGLVYQHYADKPAELVELNVLLYDENNTQRQVYDTLTDHGDLPFPLGFQSINRHRGKDCRCFKQAPFLFCFGCKRDLPSCVCGA